MQICDLGGRSGGWFSYASVDINQTFAVSAPPSGFVDRACAAWNTGGPIAGITAPSTYAGIGFNLVPSGETYDLTPYTGVMISMESGQAVTFVITDASGGLFGGNMTGGGTGAQPYTLNFTDLTPLATSMTSAPDFAHATQMEFDSVAPNAGYGFAIYSVSLQ